MTDDLIRAGLIDLDAIYRAGLMPYLEDDLRLARKDYRDRKNEASMSELGRWPAMADRLAQLTDLDRDECAAVADDLMSFQATALRVIRRFAAEAGKEVRK